MRILVVGAGDIGMPIIKQLSQEGHILAVIESDEEKCGEIAQNADAAIFNGSGDDPEIWRSVEADKIDAVLALTNDDEVNLRVCQIAKKEYGIPFVIARAHQPENMERISEAGADIVICPSEEVRRLFLNTLESPGLEVLYENAAMDFKIVMVTIPLNGSIVGEKLRKIDILKGCRVIGIFHGRFTYADEETVFKGGDKVILCGPRMLVEKASKKLRSVEAT
ncbi:MAG: TrkA family potassium uptake protein [Candidatus Brockarchaeota archaeon]|nr:TrkA family potassium uptake protein [Candidatus Brockarchaeota archaeon]MBO3808260.1 TrkA family potassium uptake protein [Candidatus Brockarchaeota archaeon]